MSSPDETRIPGRGDVILRATGNAFELIDAVSLAVLACNIPSIAVAIEEARSRNASEIWQQEFDFSGQPLGDAFRLQRPHLQKP